MNIKGFIAFAPWLFLSFALFLCLAWSEVELTEEERVFADYAIRTCLYIGFGLAIANLV